MFEYLLPDGTALPENEVIKLAKDSFTDINTYIKKNKLTLRPKQKKVEAKKEVVKPVVVEKPVAAEKPIVEKVKPAPIEKFNAKQFAKDLGASKGEGFYTKGERNIEKSGIKIKQLEDKTVQDVFDNFSDLSYTNLSPEEKNTIDDRSVELLSKKYKVGEDYSLSSNDIELKSKELLALASKKKKAIEGETYGERILDATAAGLNYAGEMFASMPETIYRVFALPQNAISMMTGNKELEASPEKLKADTGITNPIMDYFIDERNRLGKKNEIYDNANYDSTSIATNLQDGNYTDAFKLLGSGLAESAPISVGLMMGGAEMGIAKAAASSTALFAGPNVREQKEKKLDDSELSTVLKGFGIAGAEGVFSAIGEGSLGKVYKDIIKREGADVGSKIFKDGLVVAYQTALKKYGAPAAMLGEGLEEVATTVTQNLINEKPAFEGAMDSFIAGVGGGAVWGAPVNIAKATQGFKDGVTVHQINKTLKDQPVKTIKDVFNPNTPITNAQVNISLIPNSYKILNSQLDIAQNTDEITGEEADAIRKEFAGTYYAANKLKELKLNEDNNTKIANLLKERGALKAKVDAVNDPTLTTIQSNRIKELNVEIEGVIKDNAKTEIEKGIALSEKSILETGEKVYEKPLGTGKSFEVFDTAEEAQGAYDKWAEENGKKSEDIRESDGFKLPNGQMLINKERAIEVTALNVAPHELLHNIIDNEFTEPSKAEELKNKFLGTLSKAEREKLDIRILAEDSKGNRLYDDEYLKNSPGEYATQFFELVRNGDIKWSDNVKESLIRMWKGIFKPIFEKYGYKNIEFTDGRDIYNFIKDYSKSIEKGTLSTRAKKLLKQGEGVSGVTSFSKSADLKVELEKLLGKEDDFDDPQEFDDLVANLEFKIKSAIRAEEKAPVTEAKTEKPKTIVTEEEIVKEIIKNEKGTISSDKVQQIYSAKGKEGADEIIKLFKPITAKIVDKRRDAPGFDKELLTDEIESGKGGILDLIMKYDPNSGVPLAAYINKYLPVRAITSSRRVLESNFTSDVEAEVNVRATETADQGMTVNAPEKPKYKNALESNILEPKVLENVTNKIISTVRLLKSRIDAPVTLNRTVTPLIAEIRDEIGKQLDIDIKTMLGGKKDGVLRKELLKAKRYILENMTTTWLMGKDGQGGIPQAIQKRIDGQWVSFPNWAGQKIDREAMSTDLAGRTSGAELVRRLPNVFNNVSNEEFLAQIIGPDGNPIRGRKESISKAMAEEVAFDITKRDLEEEGPIYDALKANQERLGVEILENLPVVFAKQADRGNIKLSKSVVKGINISTTKLAEDIFNAPDLQSEIKVINNWIASDGRSIRTLAYTLFGKDDGRATNLGLFKQIIAPIIKVNSKFEGLLTKDAYNIKQGARGYSIYLGEDKIPLWKDTESIKKDWKNNIGVINSEAIEATNRLVDIVDSFKKGKKTEDDLRSYFAVLKFDQRGLARKVSKAGLGVLGLKANQKPYLEHNAPNYDIMEKFVDYFNKKITEKQLRKFVENSKVNLVPVELNNFLPAYKEGMNRMHAPKVVLYLQGLIDKGHTILNLENEYGSKRKFNALVNLAKSNVNSDANINNANNINAVANSPTFSKTPKGISVFDFDDTVGLTKGSVLYTMPGDLMVYHGAPKGKDVTKISNKGVKFFATDKREADEYARMNSGVTQEFLINESDLVNEDAIIEKINELGLKPKNKEFEAEDASFYELIDTRFEESLSKADITKLFNALKKDGIKAISYSDGAQVSGRSTTSIAVIDPSIIATPKKLNAEEFAKNGSKLLEDGAVFDFSEFSKVVDGKPGPMVQKMKKMIDKFGPKNFFILTARPADAAGPIHEFLKSIDINIPLENITGLGNSTAQAKADWMVGKAAEGYNDFYFADDAPQNVEAVKKALEVPGITSKVQQAKLKFSLTTKQVLKWELDEDGHNALFTVGGRRYYISLIDTGAVSYDDKTLSTLYEIAEKNDLDTDEILVAKDGSSLNLEFLDRNKGQGITDKGNAFKVISIVANGMMDRIKDKGIETLVFTAKEPSRIKLYNALSTSFSAKLGWDAYFKDGVYVITKNKDGIGADTGIGSLKEVRGVLNVVDIKSPINQAKIKFSKTLNSRFNDILQENVGLDPNENFSDILAKRKGTAIGKYRFFVPPSAADFELLLYDFLGRGKVGERQYKFFTKALLEPYSNGIALIDAAKQSIKNDYTALKKAFPDVNKNLGKLTPDGNFTYDQAIRVSMWNSMGAEIPGLDQTDITAMVNFVNNDASLSAYKAGLIATGRQGTGWIEPTEYWDAETIISDLHNITEKLGRKKYLAEFIDNSKEIFTPENLNRIEVVYGSNFREALEDSIYSMSNGTNREGGPGRINAAWLNWINNSTGAIMFWNTRSAVLQTVGAINYLNWRDNNPLNAAKAFANQPQYWKDFSYIWNSDKMKERRSGLKEDVSSAEIANAAAGSKNKANAVISYLLKKGFLPTQIGDSFAIASGGAAFYRNRIDYNLKQGMSEAEAESNAWKEFLKVTDQTQQSGDPRDVSQQQRSAAGRLVLAFQNTSMQQARLVKKAGLDLINNRGDAKTNISKIVYYTAVQNIIFGSLQSALFATIFSSDSDEEKEKKKQTVEDKWLDIGNNIVDTILRGSGMAGAIVATLKNTYLKYNEEHEKGFKGDYAKVITEAANIAPPLGSKFTKMMGAMKTGDIEKDVIAKRGWGITQGGRLDLSPSYSVLGQGVEAVTNLPMNRFVTKVGNLSEAMDSRNKSWQRIALAIGYSPYIVGAKNEESDIIKAEAKIQRKIEGKEKAIETRRKNKEELRNMPASERRALREKKREEKRKLRERKRNMYK